MILCYGRRCYRREVKPFKNSEETVTFRWYPAPEGAKILPYPHPYEQLGWTPRPWEHTGLGEVYEAFCHYGKCKIPPCVTGQGPPLGDKDLWMNGTTYDPEKKKTKRDKNGIPLSIGGGCEPIWVDGEIELALALPIQPQPIYVEGTGATAEVLSTITAGCCLDHPLSHYFEVFFATNLDHCWYAREGTIRWNGSQWVGSFRPGTCGQTFTFTFWCEEVEPGMFEWRLRVQSDDGCVDSVRSTFLTVCVEGVSAYFSMNGGWLDDCGLTPTVDGNIIVFEVAKPRAVASFDVAIGLDVTSHGPPPVVGHDAVTFDVAVGLDVTSHTESTVVGHDTVTLAVRGAIEVASSLFQPSSVIGSDTAMLGVRGGIEVVSYVYGSIVGSDIVTLGVSTTLDVTSHVES